MPVLTTQWIDPHNGSMSALADYERVLFEAGMYTDERTPFLNDDLVLFAFDDDELVGVALGRLAKGGFTEWFGHFESLPIPQGILDKLAVVPKAQGRGVGRALVREFAAGLTSHGCTHLALTVDQSTPWEERVKFFESCGFYSLREDTNHEALGAAIKTLLEIQTL